MQEDAMDLYEMLGVSRQTLLIGAACGLAGAIVFALLAWRRRDKDERVQVELNSRS